MRWSAASPSETRPVVWRDRIYEVWHVAIPAGGVELSLVERDARDGKVRRSWPVKRWQTFFDVSRSSIGAVTDDRVELTTEFIVLD